MKAIYLSLSLLLTASLYSQDFSQTKNTFLTISLTVSSDIANKLDDYEPTTEREKEVIDRNLDSLDARLTRFAIQTFYQALKERKNIPLEPVASLRGWVDFGQDGLPNILIPKTVIKKLAKKGYKTDYYFKFNINVNSGGSILGGLKPNVLCDIRVFDTEREVIKDVSARYKREEPIKSWDFPDHTFDKLGLEYHEALQPYLEELVRRAVLRAVEEF